MGGPLLSMVLLFFLYRQLMAQPDLHLRWKSIQGFLVRPLFWLLMALMLVNWTIEAVKWQLLVRPLEPMRLFKALKAVLAGCSITMITPNRTGEFGGRMLFVNAENRIQAISATLLGSMSQLAVTALAGIWSLFFFHNATNVQVPYSSVLFWSGIVLAALSICFVICSRWFIQWLMKIKYLQKLAQHLQVWKAYSINDLLIVFLFSALRYSVFILQFIIAFRMVEVDMPIKEVMFATMLFFLAMAVIPTIGFTELPVKLYTANALFGCFSANAFGIASAVFLIWLINLLIPSVVGSLTIMKIKLIRHDASA